MNSRSWTRQDWQALALYACAAVSLGFVDFYIRRNPAYVAATYIPGVVAGTYEAPFIYRVLAPFVVHGLSLLSGAKPILVFEAVRLVTIFGSLIALHGYLRTWFSTHAALAATLAMAALLPLTFTNSWQHPDTFFELLFFAAGAAAIARRRDGWFAAILVVAAFNRETSAFLLLLWWADRAVRHPSRTDLARGVAFGAAWIAVYAGLRLWRGFQGYTAFVLVKNLTLMNPFAPGVDPRLTAFSWFWVVLVAIPVWLGWGASGTPGAPPFARRALGVACVYLVVALAFSVVAEPRTLVPLFPLLAPAALLAFVRPVPAADPPAGSREPL
jgi:hypothetical protein